MRDIGTLGVWSMRARLTPSLSERIERLGYAALWIGGSPDDDLVDPERCLDQTESLIVATGIVNIWRADARVTAASYHRLEERHPGRFLLGIGSGHPEADPARHRPLAALNEFLDVLDDAGVPRQRRVLAALGPKTLRLAAKRSLGAHPFLTPPRHTRWAREILGPDAFLAPEQMVVARDAAAEARSLARAHLGPYLGRSNYRGMLTAAGFTQLDVADRGSDALVDAITPWGGPSRIARAIDAQLDAGADHVCLQVLPSDEDPISILEAVASDFRTT